MLFTIKILLDFDILTIYEIDARTVEVVNQSVQVDIPVINVRKATLNAR